MERLYSVRRSVGWVLGATSLADDHHILRALRFRLTAQPLWPDFDLPAMVETIHAPVSVGHRLVDPHRAGQPSVHQRRVRAERNHREPDNQPVGERLDESELLSAR